MAIPIALFTPLVLEIWLGEVPIHSVEFTRAILLYGLARSIHSPLDLCFKCYGDLKKYQIIEICCLLPALPIAYILLKVGLPLYWAILAMAITNFINNIIIIILAKRQWGFRVYGFMINAIIPIIKVSIVAGVLCTITLLTINNTYIQVPTIVASCTLSVLFVGMSRDERHKIRTIFKR